ncbi:hypothetical protein [Nannocystis pusilla]|uniref:hypothetical protein n=1 Tax=Nannocystis pusilla TaxID=889268 RepID=UPI003BF02855
MPSPRSDRPSLRRVVLLGALALLGSGGCSNDDDGASTDGASGPVPHCQLLDAPDRLAAACDGAPECPIASARVVQCEDPESELRLLKAPGGDALLHARTEDAENFSEQHEAHLLAPASSALAGIWRIDLTAFATFALLPRADGEAELWVADSFDTNHYLPRAELGYSGLSLPAEARDDIEEFVGSDVRPDDVPMFHFRRKGDERQYALYDLPGGRVEVPLLDGGFWPIWLHDVAGVLKMTWLSYPAVRVRDLEADAADPGESLIPFDQTVESLRSVALSQLGGEHVVLFADAEAGEPARLLAGEPWNYEEELPRYLVQCEPPTCDEGCAAAPPCPEKRTEAIGVALRAGPSAVRTWHLECEFDYQATFEEYIFFGCSCDRVWNDVVEHPCELVASDLAPDPDVPDTLKRTELWRRPLGFHFKDLASTDFQLGLSAAVWGGSLWLMTRVAVPAPLTLVWRIDAG